MSANPTNVMAGARTALGLCLNLLILVLFASFFFFSSRRRHTRYWRDWSSDVWSSDLASVTSELHLVEMQLGGDRRAQRQLLVDVPRGEAARPARNQEATDAFGGLGPDDGDVGDRPVGDPHFRAGEHPVPVMDLCTGLHTGRVAAVVGLGQAKAADRLASGHPGQPLLLLLLG